jgi:hypothetical protein
VKANTSGSLGTGDTTGGDNEYGYQDDTPLDIRTAGAKELKIVRLALRRMVVTAKKKPNQIVPLFQKPKMKLGVSHRKKK